MNPGIVYSVLVYKWSERQCASETFSKQSKYLLQARLQQKQAYFSYLFLFTCIKNSRNKKNKMFMAEKKEDWWTVHSKSDDTFVWCTLFKTFITTARTCKTCDLSNYVKPLKMFRAYI